MEIICHCDFMKWYERAKQLMALHGLSQADLARRIEESESNISRYLSGTRNVDSISAASKIAEALGVSLDHLILGKADYHDPSVSEHVTTLLDSACNILTHGSPGLQAALSSNIIQFAELLDLKEECHKLASDNEELKNRITILENRNPNGTPPNHPLKPGSSMEKAGLPKKKAM